MRTLPWMRAAGWAPSKVGGYHLVQQGWSWFPSSKIFIISHMWWWGKCIRRFVISLTSSETRPQGIKSYLLSMGKGPGKSVTLMWLIGGWHWGCPPWPHSYTAYRYSVNPPPYSGWTLGTAQVGADERGTSSPFPSSISFTPNMIFLPPVGMFYIPYLVFPQRLFWGPPGQRSCSTR